MKKTKTDEVFGKITYRNGIWVAAEPIRIKVCNSIHEVKVEIESVSKIYDEIQLGLMDKKVAELIINCSNEYNEEKSLREIAKEQDIYKCLFLEKIHEVEKNIEAAALQEFAEMTEDKNSLEVVFGKEKAKKLLAAKTEAEKLESLQLIVARVFIDRIEIKCKCDWYRQGGGFIILDGDCIMRPIDCLSF